MVFYPQGGPNQLAGTLVTGGAATGAGQLLASTGAGAAAWNAAASGAGQVFTASAAGTEAWAAGMTLVASTGVAGYTLINGTGTVITWTPPNDGALHRAICFGSIATSSAETGGQISITGTDPGSQAINHTLIAGGLGGPGDAGVNSFPIAVKANTAVAVTQSTALTAGGAVLYADLWGS